MKLTKSKQFLADAIHASGKEWLDGAIYATQDKVGPSIGFWSKKPIKQSYQWKGDGWMGTANSIPFAKLSPNWHQTVLSRDEYFSAYPAITNKSNNEFTPHDGSECPVESSLLVDFLGLENCYMGSKRQASLVEWSKVTSYRISSDQEKGHFYDLLGGEPVADADEWVEWDGGECPVGIDEVVDVMQLDGHTYTAMAVNFHWLLKNGSVSVTRYRLHKPEVKSTAVGDDETNLAAKEELLALERSESLEQPTKLADIYRPSIEQLAANYRNAKDYAERKQQEADAAKADADAALGELVAAGRAINLVIGVATPKPGLVVTDWRDLRVGDEVKVVRPNGGVVEIGEIGVIAEKSNDGFWSKFPSSSRYYYYDHQFIDGSVVFIRRP